MSNEESEGLTRQIVAELGKGRSLYLRGTGELRALRAAIVLAKRMSGVDVVFEPGSDPALVDYLTVMAFDAVDGALAGALVGVVVGLCVRQPAIGLAIGMGVGAVGGAAVGAAKVKNGWRVRVVHDAAGVPEAIVNAALG